MSQQHRFVIFLILLITASFTHAQQTVYISDVILVPMRSGAGVEYRIINAAMRSGTRLTRLATSEDGVWSQVRTPSGVEGWIRNQYLLNEQTSKLKLDNALKRLSALEQENKELKSNNRTLNQQNNTLSNTATTQTQSRDKMAKELEEIKQLSAGAIELDKRYQELLQKHEMIQTQTDSLRAENENLKSDQRLSFMLYGAGILIFGMIMAIILPALKPKKRYSEWT